MKTSAALLALALFTGAAHAQDSITLSDFQLTGDLSGDNAAFTLTATAHVIQSKGGSIDILSGPVALTAWTAHPHTQMRAEENHFYLDFDRRGDFPVKIQFSAAVRQEEGWSKVDFRVAPSVLEPVALGGLATNTQFQFAGAARPERKGAEFVSYLPADGAVNFGWKQVMPESEGKLFFSAGLTAQITVSPGLMREVALFDYKVMQGELNKVALLLHGAGEVTRVQGDQVLAWSVEPVTNSVDRRLVIQLNQPQQDQFSIQVQAQTPLGAFPQTADVLQLRPENVTRFAGFLRLVNQGAVRLEVLQSRGASQISPEQFPETDLTRAAFRGEGNQRFAYRFAGADFSLRLQADQILPELAVSETLAYHLAENELALEAELELDIREAPLRELMIDVPKGYAVAKLNAAGLSDYFLTDGNPAQLRLVYGQPVSGRQLVQLRLERNAGLAGAEWNLPRLDIAQAKSIRGFVGFAADAGWRTTPERTKALTEIATAFYPGKVEGLQSAFRLTDANWEASLHVERLPQTVQADALHLFSIGEGVAYGSSIINYAVTGAPVAAFKIDLSDEYYNVEFIGKDLRNWQKTAHGYIVQLQTPVTGAYTLLATYERPFKAQGETLSFTGAQPLDAQSEEGYTLVTSANQFDVKRADVSPGLLLLEPGEVPAEYRLFFDAPVLAAYRYAARPFHLKLALSPMAQGDSLNQIVDRATLDTRISKEGQALTDVRYFIKNRGNPHFRLTVPDGSQLWSATVNGVAAVPVQDGAASLVPLPQNSDPNAVLELDLKLASQSADARHLRIAAPTADAPVLLAEWKVQADPGQRLVFQSGSVRPVGGAPDVSGFIQLARILRGPEAAQAWPWLWGLVALVGVILVGLRRFPSRGGGWISLGLLALAAWLVVQLNDVARTAAVTTPTDLTFLAPVQQAGSSLNIAIENIPDRASFAAEIPLAWPAVLGVMVLAVGGSRWKFAARALGGTLIAWAALRLPNGAPEFFWILAAFLVLTLAPRIYAQFARAGEPALGAAPATVGLLLALFIASGARAESVPDSVTQTIRVEEKFALGTARIRWTAKRGDVLPLLQEPAILTHAAFPPRALKLEQTAENSDFSQQLTAQSSGVFDIEVEYQIPVGRQKTNNGFASPVPYGLINQVSLTIADLDVDVLSPEAVSIRSDHSTSNTVATLVLSPGPATLAWRPRRRDVRHEKPVFYAEMAQLYAPLAGVVEGAHYAFIRPAQGEVSELILDVPAGATVTDVADPNHQGQGATSLVSMWRFDPDRGKLRVTLNPPQSRPFVVLVRSQMAASSLPFEQSTGLLTVENTAGQQIGLVGLATGSEVQLESVTPRALSPINLEDFPGEPVAGLQGQIPGLTLRRAFRYAGAEAGLTLRAAAVEPDVRVETDDTLSLGEDRVVLADNFNVDISRAGVFDLSFLLPAGFDIESISSPILSQWTELKTDAGRVITLHLLGKTLGQHSFALTLAGPGLKTAKNWAVPQVIVREANKQQGALLVVPEQGMRLQVAAREGYTQLDPQKAGVKQKGALGFRALQVPARLALDIEQVDPWIQVTSLQHAVVSEAQVKVTANLQYQIENTGLKAFHVLLPDNAEGVRFDGEQVADFLPASGEPTNGFRLWEVKLHRRMIGAYLLQAVYQITLPASVTATTLRGVQAVEANLQRGFVTVQSDPRLQITIDPVPEALQPTEWQGIPRVLLKDLQASAANFTYRLVEPSFVLPLKLQRHEAARLLPARINDITFQSVISDNGVMLTRTRLEIVPGDKRLLEVTLPVGAKFWFAFVNDSGAWPWRDGDKILIPLERESTGDKAVVVEFFHSCSAGHADARTLDLGLLAPKFDLPLENITWKLALSDKWRVTRWAGSLQLQQQENIRQAVTDDTRAYLQNETSLQQARTAEAQQYLSSANSSLEKGDPQQARRAFAAAYELSTHDAAFNEDARVQLHNLKLQQALVGLNARQSFANGDAGALGGKMRELRNRGEANYTQQDAKDIIDINTAEENAADLRLAEKLIQQQDAAVSNPAGIRATIPEEGRVLTFHRAVAIEPWTDLNVTLQATIDSAHSIGLRVVVLSAVLLLFGLAGFGLRKSRVA